MAFHAQIRAVVILPSGAHSFPAVRKRPPEQLVQSFGPAPLHASQEESQESHVVVAPFANDPLGQLAAHSFPAVRKRPPEQLVQLVGDEGALQVAQDGSH